MSDRRLGEELSSEAQLLKHVHQRLCGDRERCIYYGKTSDCKAIRVPHERRIRTTEYMKQLEELKLIAEAEALTIMS